MTVEAATRSLGNAAWLGVFARHWQSGQVKTRLAASVGNDAAAALHRHFVEATLLRMGGIADLQTLCITPAEAIAKVLAECHSARGWTLLPQDTGHLGRRMKTFFEYALQQAGRVVLIGSDTPDLPRDLVADALAHLARVPVVLGPATDGGYYLIGLSASGCPSDLGFLFDDMPWSTPALFLTTRQRLDNRGIGCHLLPPWRDVDEWPDLVALAQRLSRSDAPRDATLTSLSAALKACIALHTETKHTENDIA